MEDGLNPNASTAAGEHRLQHPYRRHNHHQLPQEAISIPYFHSYSPYTLASNLQPDYISRPFHGAGQLPELSFFDSETDSLIDMDAFSEEEEAELEETADFLVDDQVSFINNLFDRQAEDTNLSLGLGLELGQIDEDMGVPRCCTGLGFGTERNDVNSEVRLELGLGLGMGSEEFRTAPPEFSSLSSRQPSFLGGLRVADIDSESDSDQNMAFDAQIHSHIPDFDNPPPRWDSVGFNQQPQNQSNDLEWLELEEMEEDDEEGGEEVFDTTEVAQNGLYNWFHNTPGNDEAGDLLHLHSDSEIDRELEDSLEEEFQDLEWEILAAVNNLNRDLDETMLAAVEESINEWRGNPPAAKSVVQALTVVHLSHDEIKESEISCAICWSEFSAVEPLRQLPCRHYYHGDCIMSWLDIRNTCPVCRFELPTDDWEYEVQRSEMDAQESGGFPEDLPVDYANFHVFL